MLQRAGALGLPAMFGSIERGKQTWKNSLAAYQGQYEGKEKVLSVTMKAIAIDGNGFRSYWKYFSTYHLG